MRGVATRQAWARDREAHERQAKQDALLRDREKRFIMQAALAAAEVQMQAMADEGQCDVSICPAASERYANADVR